MRRLTRSIGDALFENLGRAAGRFQENRPLPADVLESEDAYLVVFDAPGVTASDVQVRYVEDRVEVRIDRFRDFYDGFEMVYPGRGLSLAGSATLPDDATVDTESATARLNDDGTLQVRIPKRRSSAGVTAEDVGDELDETVEEADERESAGTEVGDETGDETGTDGGRQDETDAEEGADDGETGDGDEEAWERQDETDVEQDANDDESRDATTDDVDVTKEDKDHDDPGP